jgi:predicted NAD-dependent protein-ADP-ribosyltransferase YbiA (DUF1768 family)
MKRILESHRQEGKGLLPRVTDAELARPYWETVPYQKRFLPRFAKSALVLALFVLTYYSYLLTIVNFGSSEVNKIQSNCAAWLAEGEALLEQRLIERRFEFEQNRQFSAAHLSGTGERLLFDLAEHFNTILNSDAPGRAVFLGKSSRSTGRPEWAFKARRLALDLSTGAWYLPSDGELVESSAVRIWREELAGHQNVFIWTNTAAEAVYIPPRECGEKGSSCKLKLAASSSVLHGECLVRFHNLSVYVIANGTASDFCLVQLEMRVLLEATGTLGWEPQPSPIPLAIVRPFTASQIDRLFRSLRNWDNFWAFPCASEGSSKHVDLVFYANNEQSLKQALAAFPSNFTWQNCFRRIRWIETNVDPEVDVHPDGTCYQFYNIFSDPRFRNYYQNVFVLEPDVHPIRAYWLDSVKKLLSSDTETDAFWIRGSESKCPGRYAFNDYHVNGNALYNIASPRFRDYLLRVQRYFQPRGHVKHAPGCSGGYGGFDHSIFNYAVEVAMHRPGKWPVLQKLLFDTSQSPIWNFCKHPFIPWQVLADSRGIVSLVHSSWGNGVNFWEPTAFGLNRVDKKMMEMLAIWKDDPFPLHPRFRSFLIQHCKKQRDARSSR